VLVITLKWRHQQQLQRLDPPGQKTKAKVACSVLSRIAELGAPVSQRIA